jgi:septal ring factor EnvC (AmiA/AmiB activator)
MWWMALAVHMAWAQDSRAPAWVDRVQTARASISEADRKQRETLSHLFTINRRIKDIARENASLNRKLMSQEASVRVLAQEVNGLRDRSERGRELLNKRLRRLYQEERHTSLEWLFSARTPVEVERDQRFLRLLVDSDHKRLKTYLSTLKTLRAKSAQLKSMVARLIAMQREQRRREGELTDQLKRKSAILAELKTTKAVKLSELKDLRDRHGEVNDSVSYAFFERRGELPSPVEGRLAHDYGTTVDPRFRFRLMHKGFFFTTKRGADVHAVFDGRVVLADRIPGYGNTVIIDHGDNYYSVYAYSAELKVKPGAVVRTGDILALSGDETPLFGPGLYFEIRHFTDAVDPRPWIKEPGVRRAL